MVASNDTTVRLIYEVLKRHVSDDQMQAIIEDLMNVAGEQIVPRYDREITRYDQR